MKRIFVLALLALVGVFVTGRITLGEAGAVRFVTAMGQNTSKGDADAICDALHDDLQFQLVDRSADTTKESSGGKQEMCQLARSNIAVLSQVPNDMHVNITNVTVQRDWMHPWTSHVSYTEDLDITIRGANVTMKTTSEDKITLVQTLTGVKLLKLDSEIWAAE